MNTAFKSAYTGTIFAALLMLGGCSMYSEGRLSSNRVQVAETQFNETYPVAELNNNALAGLARHYVDHGSGPLDLTITYDPKSSSSTAMMAGDEASRIASFLRKQGVAEVNVSILPVNAQGPDSQALVSFLAYDALAPKDCGVMEGFDDTEVRVDDEYKLGCTVDTVFARQIARPKDLNGQAFTNTTTEGRSASNIVELQRSGAPNEPLEGQTASED